MKWYTVEYTIQSSGRFVVLAINENDALRKFGQQNAVDLFENGRAPAIEPDDVFEGKGDTEG